MKKPTLIEFARTEYPALVNTLGEDWLAKHVTGAQALLDKLPGETLDGALCDEFKNMESPNRELRDMLVDLYCFKHRSAQWVGDGGWVLAFLETSLNELSAKVPSNKVMSAYRADLRDGHGFRGAVYEIVCCAKLSTLGDRCDLHVPSGNGKKNFDIRVIGSRVNFNADVKQRKPNWPRVHHDITDGIAEPPIEARATVHPSFRSPSRGHLPKGAAHPESDQIRGILRRRGPASRWRTQYCRPLSVRDFTRITHG